MRFIIVILGVFVFTATSFCQTKKETEFALTLRSVVDALSSRDSTRLAKFVDKQTGVYILNRIGVMNSYNHYAALGFSDHTYPNLPFYDGVKLTPIIYAELPSFDCEEWSKTGTFVDTTRVDHLLTEIVNHLNAEFDNDVPKKTLDKFYAMENKSRRVVIAENNGNELVIYLTLIGERWYLTMIDKVSGDCSS